MKLDHVGVDTGKATTNSPGFTDPYQGRPYPRLIFLTEEVYSRFDRKYSIDLVLNYDHLREVASIQDIQFLYSIPAGIGRVLAPEDEWKFSALFGGNEYALLESAPPSILSARPSGCDAAVDAYLKGEKKEDGDDCEPVQPFLYPPKSGTEPKYKIVLGKEYVYIVVREGFASCVADPDSLLAFHREILKGMLTKYPIAMVNDTPVYSNYVSLLAS